MADFDTFASSLRSEFGEQGAGKKFEVFCKWFLQNDPQWSAIVEEVWLWDEYPDKWQKQDLGTDLVFRDREGNTWAVQAKFFSEHRATTKSDLNSFFGDTGRKSVQKRLWLQTTNKMQHNARTMLSGQEKPTVVFSLNDFRNSKIEYPSKFSELKEAQSHKKPLPDKHQEEAIDAVVTGLKEHDRGQLIMACGTGKTFTTLWIKEAMKAENTLVLLPSLNLLSQTMREWAWGAKDKFQILNVCSDQSVGKLPEDMSTSELSFPVTSDISEISNFLSKPGRKVLFSTYQSSPLIAAAQEERMTAVFDLAIADEAHRCAGSVAAAFSTILNEDKIRAHKRLFTTATPRYYSKNVKDAAKLRDVEVVGMDDEAVFGPIIHKLTFGEAIQRDLLNDYQVVIVGVDEPSVADLINNSEIVSVTPDNLTDARTLAAKLGLLKAIRDYDLRRLISFHGRVNGAQKFADEFSDVANLIKPSERPKGEFYTDYVSGAMKTGERQDKIQRLKTLEGYDRGIMANARCLAEGVDVPSLDGIAFIDPRGSQIEIIQAVGRAIRKVRNAKVQVKGTIVIPVFIENGDDHEASIEASNFKPVWDVLNALRAHDEVLADVLDEYRANLAKDNRDIQSEIDKVIFDLPITIDEDFASALRTTVVESASSSWEFWFSKLKQYKNTEGDCLVPKTYVSSDGCKLGVWVNTQRYVTEKISEERIKRLTELGFIWDPRETQWEAGFHALKDFVAKFGHCLVPQTYKNSNDLTLGLWVSVQRRNKDKLPIEKTTKLNEIGFIWDAVEYKWNQGFNALHDYKSKYGNCLVPNAYLTDDGFELGKWVGTRRVKKNDLTAERLRMLNDIGFVWNVIDRKWEQGFAELKRYKKEHGDCALGIEYKTEDGYELGKWVRAQRVRKKNLPLERIQDLENLEFVWDPNSFIWDKNFRALKDYQAQIGDCLVPRNYETNDGLKLGIWVSTQRSNQKKISHERKQKLNSVGFVWNV